MYVESSHANNTGIAKFINDCVYDTKTPMQLADSDCRTTINGFPIEVYVNGEYLGVYNFNHDRYSYKSYGYDYNKYPNMLVYEINSNSNTSAGAFYRYGDNAESSANVSELEYYKRDFNLIYGNRTTDSDSYSEIKTLVEWVSVAEQDLFREMISEHFNKEYLFRYLLTVLMIGAVDSLGKNMKIMTIDGQVWYPTFYDLDTVLGIDNSGYLTIEPDVEIESGSYNTSNSNLWSKVWNYFNTELKEEWAKMRQGSFTLDNLMNYIYGEQISKIPAKMYNDDAQVKYLDFGSLYTYCCHGSKEHQIRRWLRERIAYVDSMLGYFTSQEDQVTIRMNKTGSVSFDVTPYIPLYFSVKWSNATGGTQTFKLKRGETKTFNYSSTTSTDQEVIIYHAKYIKRLDNLSNLNPSSCILSNAVKLTNVEIHSSELYNINVTNNKFLRSINLENCTALGTVTATGSSLNLSNCKYLRYCNVYNTHLTEVQLNTSGGSLTEIYYPKSIQSINLVKQRLLELVGLPYGENGSEVPTSLYTISIQECPSITKLNTSSDTTIASSFASMVYVNNLTIRNSLDLASLKFDGFHRLQNVTIENMYNLEEVGFNNLLPVGETSTIKYIGMSNCPKLGTIELNCTSNDYEITFADDAILNFGGLFKLNSITSNCVLKGIKTIVVPINLESMFFTNEYGSGYSTIENIWVSSQCNVDTQATTPIVTHVDSTYSGIDFLGMNLKNIDLGALVNIPKAINFKLSPTTVNPHFNLNRDGETYKYLQPVGTLDLSNYTESLAKFFDGVDLDKLEIICNNNLPQTDLSYCFYNSSFSTNEAINKLLTKVSSITNLDYCFYKTTIDSVDILDEINMGASSSMNYTFAECPNIKTLNNVVIPSTVTSVEGMFNKCPLITITNMIVNVRGSISGLFKGCNKLTTITTLRIPNVTDVSNTFDGCTSLSSLSGFELPSSCTNVSNLFNGCYMLTELGMEFGANITAGDNWYPPNLETLHDTTISNDYVKLTNCTTLKTLNNVNISGGDLSDLFNGCTNLVDINRCTFNATSSLARTFKGCSKITTNPITTILDTVTDISEMYSGCTGITDISGMTFGSGITNATDWCHKAITTANNVTIKSGAVKFTDCTTLTTCNNLTVTSTCTGLDSLFKGCTSLTSYSFSPHCDTSNVRSIMSMFESCSKLTVIDFSSLVFTSTLVAYSRLFYQCTNAKEIYFPESIKDSSATAITHLFYGCYPTKISNLKFSPTIESIEWCFSNSAGNNFLKNVVETPGLEFCSQSVLNININKTDARYTIFRYHSPKKITDITFSGDCTDISYLCQEGNTLTEDFVIPSHITKCENTFKNCTSMTHIHSNWNNSYDSTITSTDCYSGCTGITHCDGVDLGVNEYVSGLDEVPPTWGGYGFYSETTGIYVFEIPSDNYTITLKASNNNHGLIGDGVVAWGDGTSTTMEISHTYTTSGRYVVKMHGYTSDNEYPHDSIKNSLVEVVKLPYRECTLTKLFCQCSKLTKVNMSNITTSFGYLFVGSNSLTEIIAYNVTLKGDCGGFQGCKYLERIDGLNTWNTSQVTSMVNFFDGCASLTELDLSSFDTSNVTSMENMFKNYGMEVLDSKLKIIRGIENFNTSKVTNMSSMFQGQKSLESLDLSSWDTSKATDMNFMFQNCTSLQTIIGIENWNTSNLWSVREMFMGCTSLTSFPPIENWNMSNACRFDHMFRESGCTGTFRPNWNLANIGNDDSFGLTHMFSYLKSTADTIIDLSNCTVPKNHRVVQAASYVFAHSPHTTQVKLPTNLKVGNMGAMFRNCSGLTTVDISGLDLSECTVMSLLFQNNTSLTSLDLSNLDVRNVTTFESMCEGCTNLQTVTGIETWTTAVAKGATISKMFYNCSSLTSDIDMHNIIACVSSSNAIYTFGNCTSIKNIIAPKFSSISMAPFGMFKNTPLLEKVTFTEFNDFLNGKSENSCSQSEYAIGFYGNSKLTTIEGNFNVNFTNRLGSKHYTDPYWIPYAFSWFKLCNKLTNVHFTGTIYSASNFTQYGIFNNCDTSNLTNESWQSFVSIFPENTDGVTKYISVGTSTAYIPEVYASQLTAKGYTLVTTA